MLPGGFRVLTGGRRHGQAEGVLKGVSLFTFSLKLPAATPPRSGPAICYLLEAMDWNDALDEEEGQVDRMSRSGSWPVAAMVKKRVRSGGPGS